VFFGKEREKPSDEKTIERPSEEKSVEKPSGEKPSEQHQPKPKLKLMQFHCNIVGEMVTRVSFASRESVRREWRRSRITRTSTTLPMVYLSLMCKCPKAKAIVRTVRAWGDRTAVGGAAGRATQVGPVRHIGQTSAGLGRQGAGLHAHEESCFGSGGLGFGGWSGEFTGGQFARRSPPLDQYRDGRSRSLRWRGGTVHGLSFVLLVLHQLDRVGSLVVVTVVVFVDVALVGEMFWSVLTPLWSKWLDTGFILLVLTPVLSHFFTHVLVF
jgi:hypothetical protein